MHSIYGSFNSMQFFLLHLLSLSITLILHSYLPSFLSPLISMLCTQHSHVLLPAAAGESVRPSQNAASPHLIILVSAARRCSLVRECSNWPWCCSEKLRALLQAMDISQNCLYFDRLLKEVNKQSFHSLRSIKETFYSLLYFIRKFWCKGDSKLKKRISRWYIKKKYIYIYI